MKEKFRQIPLPLQKQIIVRVGFGFAFSLVFVLMLFIDASVYTVLAGIGMLGFCFGSAGHLFLRCTQKEYIIVTGECVELQKTLLGRRVKAMFLKCGEYTVQVIPRQHLRRMVVGTRIDLYLSSSTPVHERDGIQVLHSYLAMELKGEVVQYDASREDSPET